MNLESHESRLHRYAQLNARALCVYAGCGDDAAVEVGVSTPNRVTGYRGCYCARHAEEGAARALAFVLSGNGRSGR